MSIVLQIQHLQYIATLIKDDPSHFRPKFGVAFFLDIIRKYFCRDDASLAHSVPTDVKSNEVLR